MARGSAQETQEPTKKLSRCPDMTSQKFLVVHPSHLQRLVQARTLKEAHTNGNRQEEGPGSEEKRRHELRPLNAGS